MTVPSDLETAIDSSLPSIDQLAANGLAADELAPDAVNAQDFGAATSASPTAEPESWESKPQEQSPQLADDPADDPADDLDELPDDAEMSLFDHLEELRLRIFYALIAVVIGVIGCFVFVNPIVQLLQVPAQGIKFLQLAPGEYFFVSIKVAGYSGLVVASPLVLYQIVQFVLPGLTRRERRLLAPVVFGSTILFAAGIAFAYLALIPAALNFFVTYGEGVVEQMWSIERYFEFVLLLLFSTGLAFQIPIVQLLLGALGIVNSQQMLRGWRFVVVGGVVLGAVLTPSTDPVTQSLLAGAVLALYFGGIGLVKLIGR